MATSPQTDLSIEAIIAQFIPDDSSPIGSWLTHVITTYLSNTDNTQPLCADTLFELTNDMLLTYSISTSQSQSKQLCSRLVRALRTHHHLPPLVSQNITSTE